jgi:hypothetical protein
MLMAGDVLEILNKKGLQPNGHERKQLSFLQHTSLLPGQPAGAAQGVIQTALLFRKRGSP